MLLAFGHSIRPYSPPYSYMRWMLIALPVCTGSPNNDNWTQSSMKELLNLIMCEDSITAIAVSIMVSKMMKQPLMRDGNMLVGN